MRRLVSRAFRRGPYCTAFALWFVAAGCNKTEQRPEARAKTVASSQVLPPVRHRAPLAAASISGSAQVTYRPNAHVLEQEEGRKAVRGVSTDGAVFQLDAANPKLRSLAAGDTLVIKGVMARKIVGAEVQGDSVLVITQNATLQDILQQGRISFAAPVRFHAQRAQIEQPFRLLNLLTPPVYADATSDNGPALANIKGANIKGWTTDFSATPGDGRTDLLLNMTKTLSGLKAVISADGYVSDFDFESDLNIADSKFENIRGKIKNLNGMMNFRWEAGTDTPGLHNGNDRIKLPAVIGIPLQQYLDGIPLYLEISSALIIRPALTGGKEFTRGAFRINFEGNQNFSAEKGNMDADGNVTGDIQFIEDQNLSFAPMGMVVAFAAPRIELSLGFKHVFDTDDLKTPIAVMDKIADTLEKKILSPDQYDQLKNSVAGQTNLSKVMENAIGSEATAFFEMEASVGMSNSGASTMVQCSRNDVYLRGKIGVSGQAFGQKLGESVHEVYYKHSVRVDPPGTPLCTNLAPNN